MGHNEREYVFGVNQYYYGQNVTCTRTQHGMSATDTMRIFNELARKDGGARMARVSGYPFERS